MMDTDEEIAALRAKLIPEPVTDYNALLNMLRSQVANLQHRVMVLNAEITARNAANIELGEMLFNAQRKINELRGVTAQGAGTNPDFVHANASLVKENKLDSAKAPGSPISSGGDGPGVSFRK